MKKLPKWAQRHVLALEVEVQDYRKESQTLLQKTPTRVRLRSYSKPDIYLPEETFHFQIDSYEEITVRLSLDGGPHLYVNSSRDRLKMLPVASNAIVVMTEAR